MSRIDLLSLPDACFDRVASSLFFHRLDAKDKVATLREVVRVLKPCGERHVADWRKPANVFMRAAFLAGADAGSIRKSSGLHAMAATT